MTNSNQYHGFVFVVSAPSGCGKTTIVTHAIQQLNRSLSIKRVVTYTTRPARANETDGIDYHFISEDTFRSYNNDGLFLETTTYNYHHYATPASILTDLHNGVSSIVITDLCGVKKFTSLIPNAITIWLATPNLHTLKSRLIKRSTENRLQINKRLAIARQEIQQAQSLSFTHTLTCISKSKTVPALVRIIKSYYTRRSVV